MLVTPFTGLMVLPHSDVCICVGMSELNIHAAHAGIRSICMHPPVRGAWAFDTQSYWSFWTNHRGFDITLLEDYRKVGDAVRASLEHRPPRSLAATRAPQPADSLSRISDIILADASLTSGAGASEFQTER